METSRSPAPIEPALRAASSLAASGERLAGLTQAPRAALPEDDRSRLRARLLEMILANEKLRKRSGPHV